MQGTNKEIVLSFYEKVFNNYDLSEIDDYMLDSYKQHSPEVADGKEGFMDFFQNHFLPGKPQTEIQSIMEDGDKVCVFFKCTFANGTIAKVFDLYRLENGKLAEHWDCVMRINDIPVNNPNGHF